MDGWVHTNTKYKLIVIFFVFIYMFIFILKIITILNSIIYSKYIYMSNNTKYLIK